MSTSTQQRRTRLKVESLEGRDLPSHGWFMPPVTVLQHERLPSQTLTPGQQNVLGDRVTMTSTPWAIGTEVTVSGKGTDKVNKVNVWQDLNYDGTPDVLLGTRQLPVSTRPTANVTVHLRQPILATWYSPVSLQVRYDLKPTASPGEVRLGVTDVPTPWWTWNRNRVFNVGTPPTHAVRSLLPSLDYASRNVGNLDVVVRNERDVLVYGLDVRARGGDVRLTGIPFKATKGHLFNGASYDLYADGVRVASAHAANNGLRFSNDVFIRDGQTVRLDLKVNVATSVANWNLQVDVDDTYGLQAEDARTGALLPSRNVQGYHQPGKELVIRTAGSLFITKGTTPVRPQRLLLGASDTAFRVTMRVTDEAEILNRFRVWAKGDANSVDRLDFYLPGDTFPRFSLTKGGYGSDPVVPGYTGFANGGFINFRLEENVQYDWTVRVVTKRDVDGGRRNETVEFEIREEWGPADVVGAVSKNRLRTNNDDSTADGEVLVGTTAAGPGSAITSPRHFTVGNELVAASAAIVDPFGSSIPTGFSVLGEVKLTSADHANSYVGFDYLESDDLVVKITVTDAVVGDEIWLANKADPSVRIRGVVLGLDRTEVTGPIQDRTVLVWFRGITRSGVNTRLGRAENQTLTIFGTVTNPDVRPTVPSGIDTWALFDDSYGWLTGDFGGGSPLKVYGTDLLEQQLLIGSFRN